MSSVSKTRQRIVLEFPEPGSRPLSPRWQAMGNLVGVPRDSDLSVEVWIVILERCDLGGLLNLSQVSKAFGRLAQMELLRYPRLGFYRKFPVFHQFLRNVPEKRNYIRKLSFTGRIKDEQLAITLGLLPQLEKLKITSFLIKAKGLLNLWPVVGTLKSLKSFGIYCCDYFEEEEIIEEHFPQFQSYQLGRLFHFLCQLENLKYLKLCYFEGSDLKIPSSSKPQFRLERLVLRESRLPNSFTEWFLATSRSSLGYLSVMNSTTSCQFTNRFVLNLCKTVGSNLCSIRIRSSLRESLLFPPEALQSCPQLEVLYLHEQLWSRSIFEAIPSTVHSLRVHLHPDCLDFDSDPWESLTLFLGSGGIPNLRDLGITIRTPSPKILNVCKDRNIVCRPFYTAGGPSRGAPVCGSPFPIPHSPDMHPPNGLIDDDDIPNMFSTSPFLPRFRGLSLPIQSQTKCQLSAKL